MSKCRKAPQAIPVRPVADGRLEPYTTSGRRCQYSSGRNIPSLESEEALDLLAISSSEKTIRQWTKICPHPFHAPEMKRMGDINREQRHKGKEEKKEFMMDLHHKRDAVKPTFDFD